MTQHSTIIELPEAFSAVQGLGTPLNFFPARQAGTRVGLIAGIALLLLGLTALCAGIFSAMQSSQVYGIAVIPQVFYLPLVFSVILFLASLAAFMYGLSRQRTSVAVFERGFACHSKSGLKITGWEDIESFFINVRQRSVFGIPFETQHRFTVELSNNDEINFDDSLKNIPELGKVIQENTTPILYKRAADEINKNREFSFGLFLLTPSELRYADQVISLEKLSGIRVEKGFMKLSTPTGQISVRTANIPNLAVFLAVLQQVCAVEVLN